MLVKFETKYYPTIVMFGDVAKQLIKFMGHSGTIPSAIDAKDVPFALQNLQERLKYVNEIIETTSESYNNSDDKEEYVSLDKRAKPLIELLQTAIKEDEYVMWDKA